LRRLQDGTDTFAVVRVDGSTARSARSRFVVIAPMESAVATGAWLARDAVHALFAVWQWLTIRAGIPVVTAPVQDQLIAQSAKDVLGGVNFRKGCYTGQEIIARMQYLAGRRSDCSRSTPIRPRPGRASSARDSAIRPVESSSMLPCA
jgi:folate-binding protein YgfZ